MSTVRIAAIPLAVASALLLVLCSPADACLRCGPPQVSLSEQIAQTDAVVLAEWIGATPAKGEAAGSTTYRVEGVLKSPGKLVKKGDKIVLARSRSGMVGHYFLLMGSRRAVIEWGSPLEISKAAFKYLVDAPDPRAPQNQRLAFYLKYLEFPDDLIANDAFTEFANSDFQDIARLADKMPRERIRSWIKNPKTSATRIGFYGLILGLCGKAEDVQLLRDVVNKPSEEFRLGVDGFMIGYILLIGEKGLDEIDRTKLKTAVLLDYDGKPLLDKEGSTRPLPFSETYAAMQALRFMQRYAPGVIKEERLKESMRLLLDRPELADLVIADLARWKDWAVQNKLMTLYGAEEYNVPSIKRAIIRYMLVSTKDVGADPEAKPPQHVIDGKKHLAALEKKDPKTVREAKRFFFLQ